MEYVVILIVAVLSYIGIRRGFSGSADSINDKSFKKKDAEIEKKLTGLNAKMEEIKKKHSLTEEEMKKLTSSQIEGYWNV